MAGPAAGATAAGTVSATSAERFAERVRRRRLRRIGAALAVVVLLGAAGWFALVSPWSRVERIVVTGTARVPEATVRELAEPELGHALLLSRTEDVAERVRRITVVREVAVVRRWPGTLEVRVTERRPIAAVPDGAGLALVDLDGVTVQTVRTAPADLPVIQVRAGRQSAPALRACFAVVQALPADLRARVQRIGAESEDGVWLRLTGGARVEWGDAGETELKSQVLRALLRQQARVYDVRSPRTPAVRR